MSFAPLNDSHSIDLARYLDGEGSAEHDDGRHIGHSDAALAATALRFYAGRHRRLAYAAALLLAPIVGFVGGASGLSGLLAADRQPVTIERAR